MKLQHNVLFKENRKLVVCYVYCGYSCHDTLKLMADLSNTYLTGPSAKQSLLCRMPPAKPLLWSVSPHSETTQIVWVSELQHIVTVVLDQRGTWAVQPAHVDYQGSSEPRMLVLGLCWKIHCKEGELWEAEGTRGEEGTSSWDTWIFLVGRRNNQEYYQGKPKVDRSILLDSVLCKIL